MITPASSDEAVPEAGDLIFSFYPSATLEGEMVGEQIVSDGISEIAVLYQDVKAARDLAIALSNYVKRNGVDVVFEESLPSQENYNSLVAKLGNPEATFICAYIDPLLQFVQKSKESGMETSWYSQSTLYEENKVRDNATLLEGIVFSAPYFNKFSEDENVRSFRESYKKKFGVEPSVWSAFSYDSCMAILQAYDTYPNDIAEGLRQIEFQGATGPTSFDGAGRPSKEMVMVTVKDGDIVPISE
jgi:branched-chain amino acid transport system substrate-binding protein